MESVLSAEKFSFVFASFCSVVRSRYGKRLVRRKIQFCVRFLLQRGQVVQKRRFLGGFFPFNGLYHKLPGILCPLQGGYGFGLLFPSGSRLGGETNSPAGGAGFELPELGRDEILILQITVAYPCSPDNGRISS